MRGKERKDGHKKDRMETRKVREERERIQRVRDMTGERISSQTCTVLLNQH